MTTNVFEVQIRAKRYTYVHNEQGKVGRSIVLALADALTHAIEVDDLEEQDIDSLFIKKTHSVPVAVCTSTPPTA